MFRRVLTRQSADITGGKTLDLLTSLKGLLRKSTKINSFCSCVRPKETEQRKYVMKSKKIKMGQRKGMRRINEVEKAKERRIKGN